MKFRIIYLLFISLSACSQLYSQSLTSFIQFSGASYVDLTPAQRYVYDKVDSQKTFSDLFLVTVDSSALDDSLGRVLIDLPSLLDSTVYKSFYNYSDTIGHFAWNGSSAAVVDTNIEINGQLSLVFNDGLIGNFWKDSSSFQLYFLGDSLYVLGKHKKLQNVVVCGDADTSSITFTPSPTPCHYNSIKVLFIFDSMATATEPNMQLKALQCLNALNTVWTQSNVYNHAFLAGVESYDFETIYALNSSKIDNKMMDYTDAYISDANIHNLRTAHHADITVFMVGVELYWELGYARIGADNPLHAGMVVSSQALDATYHLFAHEVNHIFNCRHPREEEDPTNNDYNNYNHGKIFVANGGNKGTIMSARPNVMPLNYVKVPYLSNPQIGFGGVVLGDYTYRNNAKMANEWKNHIAEFFSDYVPLSVQLSITQPGKCEQEGFASATVSCGELPYTYEWFYSDDGINWTSFGNSSANQSIFVPYFYSVFGGTYNSRQFRVKVTDFNGDMAWAQATGYYNCPSGISFSPMAHGSAKGKLTVVQNPTIENQIQLLIEGFEDDQVEILLSDLNGKAIMLLYSGQVPQNQFLITIKPVNIGTGMNLVQLKSKMGMQLSQKIILK